MPGEFAIYCQLDYLIDFLSVVCDGRSLAAQTSLFAMQKSDRSFSEAERNVLMLTVGY